MRFYATLALAVLLAAPATAVADTNDLVLSRLGAVNTTMNDVIPNNQDFRSLTSELGVVIAPKFLSPSDTLGYSGFQFSSEFAFNSISNTSRFWCATEESEDCGPGFQKSGTLHTFGVFARKGIWLPLPSFEIGAGAVHVFESMLWAAQTYAKFGLHEGFHDWPIPSVAVRGAASRLMGSEQLDLTVASVDVSMAKSFGVQGTVNLSPYVGWNYLWIIPRSEVIDKTPETAVNDDSNDIRFNFVFPGQDNITRQRIFGGLKLQYYVFALTFEVNIALAGSSIDDRAGTVACDDAGASQSSCDAHDKSGSQRTYAMSFSLDF